MMPGKSRDFDRFYKSFFEEAWDFVDGADYVAVSKLVGDEKLEAEKLLIDAINSKQSRSVHDIGRYIMGLGELRSESAAEALSQILPETTGQLRLFVAEAIWKTNRSAKAEEVIIESAYPHTAEVFRLTDYIENEHCRSGAAYAMRLMNDSKSEFALLNALDDVSAVVRRHAARSLIERHHSRTPELRKAYELRQRTELPPQVEFDMEEDISRLDFQTRARARQCIIDLTKPAVVPDFKIPNYQVFFWAEDRDYILYQDPEGEYWFHLWRAIGQLAWFTDDYLDSPGGMAHPFESSESFRIIPRVHAFLKGNDVHTPYVLSESHPPEKLARVPNTKKTAFGWRKKKWFPF